MGTKRRTAIRTVAAAALVVTTSALIGSGPGAAQAPPTAACPQPYEPWLSTSTYPAQPGLPDLGQSMLVDTGTEPATSGDFDALTITRSNGAITLLPGANHDIIYLSGYGPQPGDLDGDGLDELIIGVDQQGEQYLLPGDAPSGTHEVDAVAISLAGLSNVSQPVGDQDGDGGIDVAFAYADGPSGPHGWRIYAGADLLAPGPGGTVAPPTPIASYPGTDLAAAPLQPGATPSVITARVTAPGAVEVLVPGAPGFVLVADGVRTEYARGAGAIGVWDRDGELLISLSAADRGGSWLTVWNLTDPCSRHSFAETVQPVDPTDPTQAPAAPADPVQGQARYTG
jgi:hypothetical protein